MNAASNHAASKSNKHPEQEKSVDSVYGTSTDNQSVFLARLMHSKGGLPVLVLSNDKRKIETGIHMKQGQMSKVTGQQMISNEGNGSSGEVPGGDSALSLSTADHLLSHQSIQEVGKCDQSSLIDLSYRVDGDFECSYDNCTEAFGTQEKLSDHLQTHSGECPFLCTHQNCGKQFTEYSSLKTHKLIHSEDESSPCDICRKANSQNALTVTGMKNRKCRSVIEKEPGEICVNKIQIEIPAEKEDSDCETTEQQIQIIDGDHGIQVYKQQGELDMNKEESENRDHETNSEINMEKLHTSHSNMNKEHREIPLIKGSGSIQTNNSELQTNNGYSEIQTDKKVDQDDNSMLTFQNLVVLGSGSQGLPTVTNSSCDLNSFSIQNVDGHQNIQLLHVGLSNVATSWLPNQTVSFPFMINCKTMEKTQLASEFTDLSKQKVKRNTEVLFLQPGSVQVEELKNIESLTTCREGKKKEKLYICEVEGCGRSFSSVGYLRYHQAVHEGKKSLQCPVSGCDRTFSWPAHLKYHQMTHSGERNFKCTYGDCEMTFMTPQRLAVHIRVHTGEKPFICGETGCGKSFTTSGNLKNHSRIHSGERPFLCTHPNCGRQFAEHSSLKKHKLVHTGEKPYLCEMCGKTFSQSGSRKVHMRGHLEAQANKKRKRSGNSQFTSNQNVVEDILEYQDYQGSESVVFSQAIGEHVVTVTTQPAEGDTNQLDLNRGVLGVEEVLTSEDCVQNDGMCGVNSTGANVVVLSQPPDMVSIGSEFTSGSQDVAGMDPMMETDDENESTVWVEND